ncbi:hypothetical protein Sjap_020748 [Stephania japonica]|uniref:BHLH domain-containing protein n=1 Tax=Stephania japonica TaxID=461633 RepID=A0AAP0FA80_9MAGN
MMNYYSNNSSTSSAFPLQESDEINTSFHVISPSSIDPFQHHHHHQQYSTIHDQQQQTLHHHVVPPWPTNNGTLSFKLDTKGQASRPAPSSDDAMKKKKKMEHRETERQRRQEMTALYKGLRSQLPPEYIQGKRSICEHMSEAVNYIKHKEKTIKELRERRDSLIKTCRRNDSSSPCSEDDNINVIVQPSRVGIEVVISTNLRVGSVIPLSSFLELLLEEGLSVVSCVSSNANKTSVHNIQSEVLHI